MTYPSLSGAGSGIDTTVPHSARIWNYWLGGEDNYAVDREAGDAWLAVQPEVVDLARAQRAFLGRAVRHLAGEVGIRQFLDIGSGLPTAENTHEVAQSVAPESRVVYVDNDPLVLAHARALLTSTPEGETRYLHADVHDTEALLEGVQEALDLTQPVAVLFMGVLGHVAGLEDARRIITSVMDRMPSGSYVTLCDGIHPDDDGGRNQQAQDDYAETGAVAYRSRSREELAGLFDGFELVEPGFVSVPFWRPEPIEVGDPQDLVAYGGVARKP